MTSVSIRNQRYRARHPERWLASQKRYRQSKGIACSRLGQGYQHSQEHPHAVLTNDDVREIRSLLKVGAMGKDLAAQFQISPSVISQIKNNHIWTHLDA